MVESTNVYLTEHAYSRMKQRPGRNKNAANKLEKRALEKGLIGGCVKGMKAIVYLGLISITALCYQGKAHAANDIPISEEYFPDSRLREYVASNLDPNQDGILTSAEMESVTEVNFIGTNKHKVSINRPGPEDMMNIKGLECFTNLRSLTITQADIDKIDVSMYEDLTYLDVSYNYLSSLDISNNTALEELNCESNYLEQINVSNNPSLVILNTSANPITSLDLSVNTSLEELWIVGNKISTIDLRNCPKLRKIDCRATLLTSINIGYNPLLCIAVYSGKYINIDGWKIYGGTGPNGEPCSFHFSGDLEIIEVPYNDVRPNMWSYKAIREAFNNKYMIGMGNETFAPEGVVTRAQFVQILYNIEGKPSVTPNSQFVDVLPDQWYTDAVAWAANNHLTAGINETEFGTNLPITREQMMTLFYKYGLTKENYRRNMYSDRLGWYKDADQISPWAVEAVTWSISNNVVTGIMSEYGHERIGSIDPKGPATREQCAQMLKNMLTNGPDPLYDYRSN